MLNLLQICRLAMQGLLQVCCKLKLLSGKWLINMMNFVRIYFSISYIKSDARYRRKHLLFLPFSTIKQQRTLLLYFGTRIHLMVLFYKVMFNYILKRQSVGLHFRISIDIYFLKVVIISYILKHLRHFCDLRLIITNSDNENVWKFQTPVAYKSVRRAPKLQGNYFSFCLLTNFIINVTFFV